MTPAVGRLSVPMVGAHLLAPYWGNSAGGVIIAIGAGGAANNVGSPKVARRFATSAGNPHRCTMIRHRHQEPRGPHRCTSRSVRNIFDLSSSWRWVYNLISVQGAPSSSHWESEGSMPAVTTTNHEVDALKLKVNVYSAFGAVLGLGVGIKI